jgi:hypothetical protein
MKNSPALFSSPSQIKFDSFRKYIASVRNQSPRKEQAMSALSQLKVTAFVKPAAASPIQQRRSKLIRRLQEQVRLAEAAEIGTTYIATRTRSVVDADTGIRRPVAVPKRVKAWWSTTESGKLTLTVRYGSRLLEFTKGKAAVEVAGQQQLVPTLKLICDAVAAGELDAQLDLAAARLKAGFKR